MTSRPGSAVASSLLTGLQVYYALSDVNDATGGGLTLTNNGGVTFGAGKVGNAATFVSASNQYLSHVDATGYQMGTGSFTLSCWAKSTTAANQSIFAYGDYSGTGYVIRWTGTSIAAGLSDGSQNRQTTQQNAWNDNAWHLCVALFNRTTNLATMYTDNNTQGADVDISAVTGSVNNSGEFQIGAMAGGSFYDGSADEIGIWNRILTGPEIVTLWNSGTGITYPFV